ncbi:Hypothetical predicted protein [Lecanosticta acicola]|uniref:Uncharacterized protein n=1 Tax=Lecanosticta acicola TaxID=111012 RepID=A0AAI9E8X4_9PEZI|nr:Hypothetical predicted protein [Lecanosticta acicola]
MAPATRRTTYHQREAPAPKQQNLPARRTTVHRKDSPPTLAKRQSTLTQIDYVSTPHSSRREPVPDSSDGESEHEDAPRPKKRRKTSGDEKPRKPPKQKKVIAKKTKSQSTLTQKWDWRTYGVAEDSEESEAEALLEEDDGPMGFIDDEATVQSGGKSLDNDGRSVQTQGDEEAVQSIESPNSSPRSPKRVIAESPVVRRESTRPTTVDSEFHPQTPKRFIKTLIPSSETPPVMDTSAESTKRVQHCLRSPLKEKSANVSPVKHPLPLKSKVSFADANSKTSEDSIPIQDEKAPTQQPGHWSAAIAYTPKKDRGPRKYDRVTSIQESEPDDEEMDLNDLPPLPSFKHRFFFDRKTRVGHTDFADLHNVDENAEIDVPMAEQGEGLSPSMVSVSRQPPKGSWRQSGVVQDSEEGSLQTPSPFESGIRSNMRATQIVVQAPEAAENPIECPEATNSPKIASSDMDLSARASEKSLELGEEFEPDENGLSSPNAAPKASPTFPKGQNFASEYTSEEIDPETVDPHGDDLENDNDGYYMADANADADEEDPDYDYRYVQNTYDPVAAALERDAARFGKTETQLNAEDFVDNFEESYDEDNETQLQAEGKEVQKELEGILSSQPREADLHMTLEADKSCKDNGARQTQAAYTGDLDDSGYGSQDKVPSSQQEETNGQEPDLPSDPIHVDPRYDSHMPSDPVDDTGYESQQPEPTPSKYKPAQLQQSIHPSQVSTVLDTQAESSRPNSSPAHDDEPHQSASAWQETLSSSPIPAPSSSMTQKSHRFQRTETQSSGALLDFSLPPPPPLYSSQSNKAKGGVSQRGRRGSGFE